MKTTLFTFLFFFVISSISAQNWCQQGSKWNYYGSSLGGSEMDNYTYTKDTIVETHSCHQLSVVDYVSIWGARPDTFSGTFLYTFSDADTIYFFNPTRNKWQAAYYWGAQTGDTLTFLNSGFYGSADDTVVHAVVDSSGIIVIDNTNLRYYSFHLVDSCNLQYTYPGTIVERLGIVNNSIVPAYVCSTDFTYYTLCAYQDDSFALHPTTGCPALPTGIHETRPVAFSILPNPAQDDIEINTGQEMTGAKLVISSIDGREIQSEFIDNSQKKVNVSGLVSGLYLVAIYQSGTRFATQKLVIVH